MKPRDIPNLITILRIMLVVPIIWVLAREQYGWALILFAVAGASDGIDGFLAKRYGWTSRLGSLLDPLADKLLQVSCFVVLAWLGHIPIWLVALIVLRDIVIVSGALAYHFRVGPFHAEPTLLSKFNTLAQIVLVLAVIVHAGVWPMPVWWIDTLVYIVLFSTVSSGVQYVVIWGRRARIASGRRRT